MRRKIQLICLLSAWLLATGSQWDMVQVFAWGRMFAGYAREMPLTAALGQTFKPDNMCPICRAVKAAKQQQDESPAASYKDELGKILLVFEPVPQIVVAHPSFSSWSPSDQILTGALRAAPPVPPPRDPAA
ncbi:MAG TPA: hypothetical protein VMI53_02330 [Opitutaceae bacterium]|nr:hypothetical protein [Opitutaceae bacterium]